MADSIQNATYSYNLSYNEIFSLDGINPSYHREPLLPFIHSVYISYFTDIPKGLTKDKLVTDLDFIEQLSRINIFYLAVLFFSIWYLVYQITKSHVWVIPFSLFSFGYFAMGISFTISQLSEVPAVILVNFFTGVLISVQRKPKVGKYVILGLLLGLLAILKAVFYYVGLGFIVLFFLFNLLFDRRLSKGLVKYSAVMTICFGIMVIPWMLRNLHYFNDFSIAERGGTVLMLRAIKNQMTEEEFNGGFYAWASEPIQTYIFEPITDYRKEDLMNGGRLRRFTRYLPEDRKYYAEGKLDSIQNFFMWTNLAYLPKLHREADSLGMQTDVYVKKRALKMILSDLPNHIVKSVLFFWRGIWFYEGKSLLVNLVILLVVLIYWISLIIGWIGRDRCLIIISILPVLYLAFHIFLTHNLPRYSYPILTLYVFFPFIHFFLIKSSEKV
ncbi:hypothetical protein [Algoriphagus namhaensis]